MSSLNNITLEEGNIVEYICDTLCENSLKDIADELEIKDYYFIINNLPFADSVHKFIEIVEQQEKTDKLVQVLREKRAYKQIPKNHLNFRLTSLFSDLFHELIDKLPNSEEKDFEESELFDPLEFEEKMINKAKFSQDRVNIGIISKTDISILRRKAYNIGYKDYEKLRTKIARFYINDICIKYPPNEYDADFRFSELFKVLYSMVKDKFEDVDELVEGIIYDIISKCLIFNN